jgi:hypothetical protein
MLDRAILPRRIHRLENQQDGVVIRSVEALLLSAELIDMVGENVPIFFLDV